MIDIPDFRAGHLDLSRFDGDIGAAFQAFVGELLVAEGIDAHAFPAAGKDGGIDLVEELGGDGIRVYECKVATEGQILKAALQRWKRRPKTSRATSLRLMGRPLARANTVLGTTPIAPSALMHSG